MQQTFCSVTSNVEVAPGVHLMWFEAPHIASAAQPGQFVTVRCADLTLRRPFSIYRSSPLTGEDSGEGGIALLFKVTGQGTLWLSQRKKGETIDILGPLGNAFAIRPRSGNLLLIAGGIGIAPLVFLMQHTAPRHQITLIHGASTAAQLYPERRQLTAISDRRIRYVPVTEDGSLGQQGKATDVLPQFLDWADQVYACGPIDMYKAMAEVSLRIPTQLGRSNLKGLVLSQNPKLRRCQVSLEVRMGCGFGACYGCTINTRKGLKQVCRDGPIFGLGDILWQEVRV